MAISSTSWKTGRRKTGGRRAGVPNRVTEAHRKVLAEMQVDRSDPLSFFLSVLRNPTTPYEEARVAAKEALPYCSPRLASIEARAGGPSHEERLQELQRMLEDDE
jgi:hypothetical protein